MSRAYAVPGKTDRESLDHPAMYGDYGQVVLDWAWEDRANARWNERMVAPPWEIGPYFAEGLQELYLDGVARFAAQESAK